ncbi:MAG: CDP-glycerol glycerophosphotransferase family protein [Candidatus Sumerlaeota bacterium]|nr:CDP-glycerol glycerophosphotransferase family protein [Candidatus Sumerlaeota bacterium]
MNRRSILFFAKAPMNVVMFRPLVERLRGDGRLRLLFTGRPELGLSVKEMYALAGLPDVPLLPAWWARIRPVDVYISPDMMLLARRARHKVQIYHGVSFKGRMYDPKILAYDKLFLIGEDMRRRYIERGLLKPDDPRLERIGMPKTDRLVDGSLDRDAILRRLGLDPARKTVLYAPTWRKESSLYSLGRDAMRDLGAMPINLLIKLHDLVMDPATNPVDWRAELPKYARENVRVIEDVDIIPYLFVTDVLISDASSVANEFTLLDRPILFIDVPALFERYKDSIDLGGWGRRTGEVVADMQELRAALDRAFENPSERSEIRRAAAADIFYHPGRATEQAAQALYRLLEMEAR